MQACIKGEMQQDSCKTIYLKYPAIKSSQNSVDQQNWDTNNWTYVKMSKTFYEKPEMCK